MLTGGCTTTPLTSDDCVNKYLNLTVHEYFNITIWLSIAGAMCGVMVSMSAS